MATIIPQPPTPEPAPEPQAKKPEQISIEDFKFWYMEMTMGTLKEATDKYLGCIAKCYRLYGQGKPELNPGNPSISKKKRTIIPISQRREKYRNWKIKNTQLRQCLLRCENEWYETIVNLLGQKRENIPDDILNYILQFLTVQKGKRKRDQDDDDAAAAAEITSKKSKPNKKKGGRKTRRKKGTKRRKTKRRKRKSKKKH